MDVSPLAQMRSLGWLVLAGTQVEDVKPIAALPNLAVLDLTGAAVAEIAPLAAMDCLQTLVVADTVVTPAQLSALKLRRPGLAIAH